MSSLSSRTNKVHAELLRHIQDATKQFEKKFVVAKPVYPWPPVPVIVQHPNNAPNPVGASPPLPCLELVRDKSGKPGHKVMPLLFLFYRHYLVTNVTMHNIALSTFPSLPQTELAWHNRSCHHIRNGGYALHETWIFSQLEIVCLTPNATDYCLHHESGSLVDQSKDLNTHQIPTSNKVGDSHFWHPKQSVTLPSYMQLSPWLSLPKPNKFGDSHFPHHTKSVTITSHIQQHQWLTSHTQQSRRLSLPTCNKVGNSLPT